jgi:hypothetical protein
MLDTDEAESGSTASEVEAVGCASLALAEG